jgi:hypothetical protein
MTIKLDNEDFIFAVITASECDDLQVKCLASGYYESVGFYWYLVSYDGQSVISLYDREGGTSTSSEEFAFTDKKDLTDRLLKTIQGASVEDLETSVAIIFGSEDASVDPEFIDKDMLLGLMQRGMAHLNCEFDPQAWSKKVGFK